MSHSSVATKAAPTAIGPYVQAKVAQGSRMIFCVAGLPKAARVEIDAVAVI